MYTCRVSHRLASVVALASMVAACPAPASGQAPPASPASEEHQHPAAPGGPHDADEIQMAREGSGTSWLPDASPMYAIHWERGAWQFMVHENVFLSFLHESGNRGGDQTGSINWFMGMAERRAGPGRLQLRGMISAEPWTIRGCGYPDLLASGEQCDGAPIHDRQHPHDFAMELAAAYDGPLRDGLRWQVYAAPVGEPALGPVAFPHRISAMPNPLAPVTHHWLDATHISFGVVTGGVYGQRWKAEASVFNGREPDEHRTDFDFGRLDSVSGRLWFLPSPAWAFQASIGKLTQAEAAIDGDPAVDVTRATASAAYHRVLPQTGTWATTLAWGRNAENGHASNAVLAETNVTLRDRDAWFGRLEAVGKSAHDLDVVAGADAFTVAKLQGGYTRYFDAWHGLRPGLGGSISAGFVPGRLQSEYGGRVNLGVAVFLALRPASVQTMTMTHGR